MNKEQYIKQLEDIIYKLVHAIELTKKEKEIVKNII